MLLAVERRSAEGHVVVTAGEASGISAVAATAFDWLRLLWRRIVIKYCQTPICLLDLPVLAGDPEPVKYDCICASSMSSQ